MLYTPSSIKTERIPVFANVFNAPETLPKSYAVLALSPVESNAIKRCFTRDRINTTHSCPSARTYRKPLLNNLHQRPHRNRPNGYIFDGYTSRYYSERVSVGKEDCYGHGKTGNKRLYGAFRESAGEEENGNEFQEHVVIGRAVLGSSLAGGDLPLAVLNDYAEPVRDGGLSCVRT